MSKAADINAGTTSPKPLMRGNGIKAKIQARATSTASSTKATKIAKTIVDAIKKADTEITKRVESLNKTLENVNGMKNVSASEKATLSSEIQSEISKLQALNSKIATDTDIATIKTDLATIISGSRIYALVIPRANILASVDKVNTIATMLETVATKLQIRIDEAKATGTVVTTLQTALDSMIVKTADAKKEALTAQTTISGLVPDNGNKATLEANTAALKLARTSIKNANADLAAARKAASIITNGLKAPGSKAVKKGDLKKTTTSKSN